MTKILSFSIITCLSISCLFAQNDVKWGPVYKKEGGIFSSFYPAGMDDENYYLVMKPKKSNNMLTFDLNHKLVSNSPIDLKIGNENAGINSIIETQGGQYAIMQVRNKPKKQIEVHAAKFEKGRLGKTKKIHAHEFKVQLSVMPMFLGFSTYTNSDNFQEVIISDDGSKVAYMHYISTKDKNKNDVLSIAVFDQDFNKIWSKKKTFPYKDKKLDIEQMIVSNDGDVFISAELSIDKTGKNPDYDYKIFRAGPEINKEWTLKLDKGNQPTDAGLFISDTKENLNLGGTYTTAERRNRINGVFFASLDLNTGDITKNTYPFKDEFLEGLLKESAIKKGKGLRTNYKIDQMVTFDDGSYSFLAENFFITYRTTSNGNSTRTTPVYNSHEIIIPRFSKEGELIQIDKIEKEFSSQSPSVVSYTFAAANSKIYLIYNDFKRRKEKKAISNKKGLGTIFTDMTIIDSSGNIEEQKTIFTNKDDGMETIFVPSFSMFNEDYIMLSGLKLAKYQFGTLKLK